MKLADLKLENLFESMRQGDYQTLLTCITTRKFNLDACGVDGLRLIHFAAMHNQSNIIKLLLDQGATNDIRDYDGNTPFHLAAMCGQLEAIKVILAYNPMMYLATDEQNPNTPFHLAAENGRVNIVEFFLSENINPNVQNYELETPLHSAAKTGQAEVMELLLNHRAYSSIRSIYNVTPLHVASKHGHIEAMRLLLEYKAFPNAKQGKYMNLETPLHLAIEARTTEGVKLLLKHMADPNMKTIKSASYGNYLNYLDGSKEPKVTLLYLATLSGHFEIVKALIEGGARLADFGEYKGNYHKNGFNPIVIAATISCQMLQYLLDIAKHDTKNYQTWLNDALHAAASEGCIESMQYILSLKPDINGNTDHNNPLFGAVIRNKIDAVKLLIKHDADVYYKNSYGTNMLHMVNNSNPALIRYFIDLGVDIESKGKMLYNDPPFTKKTPLEDCGVIYHTKTVLLCSQGAYINLFNRDLRADLVSRPNFIFREEKCTKSEKVAAALNILHAFSQEKQGDKDFANYLSSQTQPYIQSLIYEMQPCSKQDISYQCRSLRHLEYLAKISSLTLSIRCDDQELSLLLSKLLAKITEIKDINLAEISKLLLTQMQREPTTTHSLSKIFDMETDILSDIIKYLDYKSIINWSKTRAVYTHTDKDHVTDSMEVDLNGDDNLHQTSP